MRSFGEEIRQMIRGLDFNGVSSPLDVIQAPPPSLNSGITSDGYAGIFGPDETVFLHQLLQIIEIILIHQDLVVMVACDTLAQRMLYVVEIVSLWRISGYLFKDGHRQGDRICAAAFFCRLDLFCQATELIDH